MSRSTPDPGPETAGLLVLVVGPSGAGKDSLMQAAERLLDGRVHFVRREITRPADKGGEAHLAIGEAEFAARRVEGGYTLSWHAHGLGYGLPVALAEELRDGRTVVANVSRAVLGEARRLFPRLRVLSVCADPAVLRRRLLARGRESAGEVEARVARAAAYAVTGPDVVEVRNDGELDEGVARFVAALTRP